MGDGKAHRQHIFAAINHSRRVAMFLLDATQIEQEIEKAFADDLAYFTRSYRDGKSYFTAEYGSA